MFDTNTKRQLRSSKGLNFCAVYYAFSWQTDRKDRQAIENTYFILALYFYLCVNSN